MARVAFDHIYKRFNKIKLCMISALISKTKNSSFSLVLPVVVKVLVYVW